MKLFVMTASAQSKSLSRGSRQKNGRSSSGDLEDASTNKFSVKPPLEDLFYSSLGMR